jgi:hypothetical protein
VATPAPTADARACPIAFTMCSAGCCPRTIKTLRPPITLPYLRPQIEDKIWVDFTCPPTGNGACGPRNYYFYISGYGFTPGGSVKVQFWAYPDPQVSPQGGILESYNTTGESWGVSSYLMRGEFYNCKIKAYIVAIDESTGRKSNRVDALVTWQYYKNAC